VIRSKNTHLLSLAFLAALIFSGSGLLLFARTEHLAMLQDPGLFWFIALWILAQILFILVSVFSLRAAMRLALTEQELSESEQLQRSILDSAGAMIVAADVRGRIIIFNPAAERMLGYRADEVVERLRPDELFPDGEMERMGRQLIGGIQRAQALPSDAPEPVRSFLQYVSSFPSTRVRGFEMSYRRKDGSIFPAMVYLSAIRSREGSITGLVSVSTDLSATKRAEQALRESEERYRDLFENSAEMIATLSPRGRYLYVNPAWQSHFGMTADQFESLMSFESAFSLEVQAEAAVLFRQALLGMKVEAAPLRLHTRDGGTVEVEASMSCRRESGSPVSVRCIFRDVTERNRRERRLRMQLQVSQIIGESSTAQMAVPQILAALCSTLGSDVSNFWVIDEGANWLKLQSSWAPQGRASEEFRAESASRRFHRGEGLPGMVWARGEPHWVSDLRTDPHFVRGHSARLNGLMSGWAVPIRVGNQVIAVMEFFSRHRMREDAEITATVETICASIGQFLARSSQESRVVALNQQKEFILNSVADAIFGVTPDGMIDFVNPAASRLLGTEAAVLIGKRAHAVLHGALGSEICGEDCRTRLALQTLTPTMGQDIYLQRDGRRLPVEFSVMPMLEENAVVGSVLSFRDNSQRYALDRMKDEFVSTVSHELRTPLTSIRGSLGLLSAGLLGELNEKASSLLRIAVTNSDRLIRLINDILDLERMQSGRATLNLRRLSIRELAQQAMESMQPLAENSGVTLTLEAEEDVWVDGDPDRLQQVTTNLLSNAIKFSPPQAQVRLRIHCLPGQAQLSVVDEGRGIPADKLESIFDRFQQVDASDSRQKGGTGLGLAICRTIVEQHGGRIWAEQNELHGATLHVLLPVTHEMKLTAGSANGFRNAEPPTTPSELPAGTRITTEEKHLEA
jgi:PAS domain S-box-containing protein